MKKYLIDQDHMTYLLRILDCYPMMRDELERIKPVEPLNNAVITQCWESVSGTSCGYAPFARAIERHIIGD